MTRLPSDLTNLSTPTGLTTADKKRIAAEAGTLALVVAVLLSVFVLFSMMLDTEMPKPPVLAGEVAK